MEMPRDFSPVYLCPVCGLAHPSRTGAEACAASTEPAPPVKPGDFLVWHSRYSWRDGGDAWLAKEGRQDWNGRDMAQMFFWMVVTAVTPRDSRPSPYVGERDCHQWVVHLQTRGLQNGMPEGRGGYIWWKNDHYSFRTPDMPVPEVVRAEAQSMVGQVFKYTID